MGTVPIAKRAISYGAAHEGGTRKASPEAAWNGPREVAQASNDAAQLRRMHAWRDRDGDPEAKSSYKLPHHQANGTLVLRGVRAALGALMGARGGVAIPTSDRRGVYNHLARHLREFDLEPPEFIERALVDGETFEISKLERWIEAEPSDRFSVRFKVAKVEEEQGLVFGWASIAEEHGALVVDHEGDVIQPAELEKGAYRFVRDARVASDSHDPETIGVGVLVESMFFGKEKQEILGIDVPVGWWVGFEVQDEELRAQIREGQTSSPHGLSMFSIGGFGAGVEL